MNLAVSAVHGIRPAATRHPDEPIRVLLLDDQEIVRHGIAELLSSFPDLEVVGEAATARQALDRVLEVRPDVAVLDLRLPDGSGVDVCREIRSALPQTHCLILTSYDDHEAEVAALLAGASGYMLKSIRMDELVDAIRRVAAGVSLIGPGVIEELFDRAKRDAAYDDRLGELTDRERDILDLLAEGLTNREIGKRMALSEKTIKNYVSNILRKLGLQRRTQAAVVGVEMRGSATR
jgi:two-component system, NarL family, response regulator DevR